MCETPLVSCTKKNMVWNFISYLFNLYSFSNEYKKCYFLQNYLFYFIIFKMNKFFFHFKFYKLVWKNSRDSRIWLKKELIYTAELHNITLVLIELKNKKEVINKTIELLKVVNSFGFEILYYLNTKVTLKNGAQIQNKIIYFYLTFCYFVLPKKLKSS